MSVWYTIMHKILLIGMWIATTAFTLLVTIFFFFLFPSGGTVKGASDVQNVSLITSYSLYTALPSSQHDVQEVIVAQDARVEIIRQFLERYDSPLLPHAKLLVDTADTYNMDFRLLPAVAMQESGLCKKIPPDSYNCWGYGIYGDKVLRFSSFEEAIEKVGKGLSGDYIYDGLTTPELIMSRYTPSSNGSWAASVRHFMESME